MGHSEQSNIEAVLSGDQSWHLACQDSLDFMGRLPDSCVDLILTDPPYKGVKDRQTCAWDHQWKDDDAFLAWIGELCGEWKRLLKPNGSLYVFASPEMAARVECKIGETFNVLNHIVWSKSINRNGVESGSHKRANKEILRTFFSASERIIFAEHSSLPRTIGSYLQSEREHSGITRNDVDTSLGFVRTKNPQRGTELCRRWEEESSLPTAETYARYRSALNSRGGQFLSREYQDLIQEYETARRPFSASPLTPYTDVWDFPTVGTYFGKHPCEKPFPLLEHILSVSSLPDALVLDCFAGSGNVGKAALSMSRRFLGCDFSPKWAQFARERISHHQLPLFAEVA